MTKYLVIVLLLILCFFCEARAQMPPTRIVRIEIDGKEIKTSYDVFFLVNKEWVKVKQTPCGFQIPDELKNNEFFDFSIAFEKYQLDFSQIHISKFNTDWIVGIDKKPFSDENVDPQNVSSTKMAWYINFLGAERVTRVVIRLNK